MGQRLMQDGGEGIWGTGDHYRGLCRFGLKCGSCSMSIHDFLLYTDFDSDRLQRTLPKGPSQPESSREVDGDGDPCT